MIGRRDASIELSIRLVCEESGVHPIAVMVDTAMPTVRQRLRNLKHSLRREGPGYLFHRGLGALHHILEYRAERVIHQQEVDQLLDQAFPERGLARLSKVYGFEIFEVGNLNGSQAVAQLRALNADLGVVLGTRVLRRPIFEIPRLGCVNLHKGRVPDYRGLPPGFWELYEGARSAGVTVHFIDAGLDTGDVVGTSEIPIHPKETPESLSAKLNLEGSHLLARAVAEIQDGTAQRSPQPRSDLKPRTRPTRAQTQELARRLPHWRRLPEGWQVFKLILWLTVYYSGLYFLLRLMRSSQSRAAILLYHRVNDISDDVLTANTRRFAEHLVTLRRFYQVLPTEKLVEQIVSHRPAKATAVAIHFDDCYRDVRTHAGPLLHAANAPAVAFVSSGFVDTERAFQHDLEKYPHKFENFRTQEIRELPEWGVSVAAHTVNHVDLGKVDLVQAHREVFESRDQLERITGAPVSLFSFPFGGVKNIREEVRGMVMEAGYEALFSAHGGFISEDTRVYDIPRIGVCSDHSPLALMMELEGLSLNNLRYLWGKRRRGKG